MDKNKKILYALLLLCLTSLCIYTYLGGYLFPCIINKTTGIICPSCGGGRAASALLRLDIITALKSNAVVAFILPILSYFILKDFLFYISGRKIVLPLPKTKDVYLFVFATLAGLYFIIRNFI